MLQLQMHLYFFSVILGYSCTQQLFDRKYLGTWVVSGNVSYMAYGRCVGMVAIPKKKKKSY